MIRVHMHTIWAYAFLALLSGIGLGGEALAQPPCERALNDYRIAVRMYQDGFLDPAAENFEHYLKRCSDGDQAAQAHFVLATIRTQQGDFTRALTHVRTALPLSMAAKLRAQLLLLGAQNARQLTQDSVAWTYLQEVVQLKVSRDLKTPALYWLGEIAFRKQDAEAAQRYYRRVIDTDPESTYVPQAHYSLGWLAQQKGDYPQALAAFERFLQIAPAHDLAGQVRLAYADLLREMGQIERAAVAFRQVATGGPEPLRDNALFRWAEMAYELKRYAEAGNAYEQLLTAFPASSHLNDALYGLGWVDMHQQQCKRAVVSWERWLKRQADSDRASDVHYHLGLCYIELEQFAQAKHHLETAITAGVKIPQQEAARLKLAALAFREHDYAAALTAYTQVLATIPATDSFRIHYLIAESYQAMGADEDAILHWQQARNGPHTLPFYTRVLYQLGSVYLKQHRWTEAITPLRQLWDEFPEAAEREAATVGLFQAYGQSGECAVALSFYATMRAMNAPRSGDRALRRIQVACLFSLQRYQEIIDQLVALPAEADEILDPLLLYTLAQAAMELNHFDIAATAFDRLKAQFADHPLVSQAAPRHAYALEQMGRRKEALAIWQIVLEQASAPDLAERDRLQLHVGELAVHEEQFDQALAWLSPLRESATPGTAAPALYWHTEVSRHQERWAEAARGYQDLLERFPAQSHWVALSRLRLGMMYERQEQWEHALDIYRRLRDSAVDAGMVANAERRITAIEAGRTLRHPASEVPSKG